MKIVVVGSGKLAKALLTSDSLKSCEILKWDSSNHGLNEKTMVVHAGSGRQLSDCFDFCSRTKSIFIELSTGLETETKNPDFPLIVCPNTSILVLKTMAILKANGHLFDRCNLSITESHQSEKNTEPGTAYAFAQSLNYPIDQIVSVRDPEIQHSVIGIPHDYLNKHAYHRIVIKDGMDEVTIETKVLGHDSYAKGVKTIIDMVQNLSLEPKKYSILDLLL